MSSSPQAAIIITTRNRKDELRTALESAASQTGDVEIIVVDDASTDGTPEMVRTQFPQVRLHVGPAARGYIVQRNVGARLATAPIIVSIDDDAAFTTPQTVSQALTQFDHPRIGAISIPFINVGQSETPIMAAPDDDRTYVMSTYIGTAHALRRDLFLKLGGYREQLVHFGEEAEYAMRLLQAGYVTRMGRADPINHYCSPKRQISRGFIERGRSHVLGAWYNDPIEYLPLHWMATTWNMLKLGVRCGHPIWAMQGVLRGMTTSLADRAHRRPLSRATYKLYRELHVGGPRPLSQILPRLPEMAFPEFTPADAATR